MEIFIIKFSKNIYIYILYIIIQKVDILSKILIK